MKKFFIAFIFLLLTSLPTQAAYDHAQWNALLKQHVHWNTQGTTTAVDYAGFTKDRDQLKRYLKSLSSISKQEYSKWPLNEQQAFLINAYNAYTIELVLTRYPNLSSIKDIGGLFSSPWKQKFFRLLDKERSLDDVEHGLLRGDKRYKEPRIHFAVNCASIGCPALRDEAYTGKLLNSQLEDQTIRFLSDPSRNRLSLKTGHYSISRIFDWYADDFEKHSSGVKNFIASYSDKIKTPASNRDFIKQAAFKIDYLDYDWSLNKAK